MANRLSAPTPPTVARVLGCAACAIGPRARITAQAIIASKRALHRIRARRQNAVVGVGLAYQFPDCLNPRDRVTSHDCSESRCASPMKPHVPWAATTAALCALACLPMRGAAAMNSPEDARQKPRAALEFGIDRSNMNTQWTLAWPQEPNIRRCSRPIPQACRSQPCCRRRLPSFRAFVRQARWRC